LKPFRLLMLNARWDRSVPPTGTESGESERRNLSPAEIAGLPKMIRKRRGSRPLARRTARDSVESQERLCGHSHWRETPGACIRAVILGRAPSAVAPNTACPPRPFGHAAGVVRAAVRKYNEAAVRRRSLPLEAASAGPLVGAESVPMKKAAIKLLIVAWVGWIVVPILYDFNSAGGVEYYCSHRERLLYVLAITLVIAAVGVPATLLFRRLSPRAKRGVKLLARPSGRASTCTDGSRPAMCSTWARQRLFFAPPPSWADLEEPHTMWLSAAG